MIALLVVFALVVIGFAWRQYAMKKKKTVSLWHQALADIYAMQAQPYSLGNEAKKGYVQLTAIMKNYLINRYNLPRRGITDDELIADLKQWVSDATILDDVRNLLVESSLIKFAQAHAENYIFEQNMQRSLSIIIRTIPQPQTASKQ